MPSRMAELIRTTSYAFAHRAVRQSPLRCTTASGPLTPQDAPGCVEHLGQCAVFSISSISSISSIGNCTGKKAGRGRGKSAAASVAGEYVLRRGLCLLKCCAVLVLVFLGQCAYTNSNHLAATRCMSSRGCQKDRQSSKTWPVLFTAHTAPSSTPGKWVAEGGYGKDGVA